MAVGTRVRVIEVAEGVMKDLPADENEDLQAMVGRTCKVYDVGEHGQPLNAIAPLE